MKMLKMFGKGKVKNLSFVIKFSFDRLIKSALWERIDILCLIQQTLFWLVTCHTIN